MGFYSFLGSLVRCLLLSFILFSFEVFSDDLPASSKFTDEFRTPACDYSDGTSDAQLRVQGNPVFYVEPLLLRYGSFTRHSNTGLSGAKTSPIRIHVWPVDMWRRFFDTSFEVLRKKRTVSVYLDEKSTLKYLTDAGLIKTDSSSSFCVWDAVESVEWKLDKSGYFADDDLATWRPDEASRFELVLDIWTHFHIRALVKTKDLEGISKSGEVKFDRGIHVSETNIDDSEAEDLYEVPPILSVKEDGSFTR